MSISVLRVQINVKTGIRVIQWVRVTNTLFSLLNSRRNFVFKLFYALL